MNPRWLERYPQLNEAFIPYGWVVAPYMTGGDLEVVDQTAEWIKNNPPKSELDRKGIEERIYQCLNEPVFHPAYRARATWYGNQLNHLKDFNHLYESAIFSYYKREYAQSVLCILCALEGVMLSYYGFDISSSERKPSIRELINKIRLTKSDFLGTTLDRGHNMYRDALVMFLENWIYKDTSQSDLSLSVLNRHYVLHGMDAGNFYRSHDLHRLIIMYDLLTEFFLFRQHIFRVFLPDVGQDEFIDARRIYYDALANGLPTVKQSWSVERDLLKQHVRYVSPSHDPNLIDSLSTSTKILQELMEMSARNRIRKDSEGVGKTSQAKNPLG